MYENAVRMLKNGKATRSGKVPRHVREMLCRFDRAHRGIEGQKSAWKSWGMLRSAMGVK